MSSVLSKELLGGRDGGLSPGHGGPLASTQGGNLAGWSWSPFLSSVSKPLPSPSPEPASQGSHGPALRDGQ